MCLVMERVPLGVPSLVAKNSASVLLGSNCQVELNALVGQYKFYNYIKIDSSCFCLDQNECTNNPCEQVCVNTDGSFFCLCNVGYALQEDGSSCEGDFCSIQVKKS